MWRNDPTPMQWNQIITNSKVLIKIGILDEVRRNYESNDSRQFSKKERNVQWTGAYLT